MSVIKSESEIIISNQLSKKISNKKYSLQFLPYCFESIKDLKTINYRGKKLKTAYLIDIVNGLILKYYFKRENKYVLNATVLKDIYGHIYNYYINYLVDNSILTLVRDYSKGKSSRTYSLDEKIFKNKISRYRNSDKILLKKSKKKIFDTIELTDDKSSLIPYQIKQKLISDLYSVKIEWERSIFFLDSLKLKDLNIWNRNIYSVDSINNGHIFYHFDDYGRLHSNFTILKSFIRKNCLLIDGQNTAEIDINNSQPLFLFKLIKESGTRWVNTNELDLFRELVTKGVYYQYIMNNSQISDRNEAKKLTYKVFFGKNFKSCKYSNIFSSLFPTIFNYIKLYKKEKKNYKSLAYSLQRMESDFIFNKIIKRIMLFDENIKVITIHDSIIVQSKWKKLLESIMNDEMSKNF
jgi:hypothetical protein